MKVYRIEDPGGYGPYNSHDSKMRSDLAFELREAHNYSSRHPGPSILFHDSFVGSYFFGFESLEDAHGWFDGWEKKLHQAGFSISVYEAKKRDVYIMQYQVAFIRDKARWLESISLV